MAAPAGRSNRRPIDVRRGDTVLVLTGKDSGKRGVVESVVRGSPASRGDRVIVQGINMARRHTKPRPRQGRTERTPRIQQGGIIEKPMPIQVANVMVVCPECGRPTRVRHDLVGKDHVRLCTHCGSPLTRVVKT